MKRLWLTAATRDRLIREHKTSAEILKPILRGRDVKRWCVEPQDLWLIFTRRGIDIKKYPAIYEHLLPLKKQLMPGTPGGRKPGRYEWYEIQDNIAYWQEFEQTKLVVPAISGTVNVALDREGFFSNNKTSIFVCDDAVFVSAVVNSKVAFWFTQKVFATKQGGFYDFEPRYSSQWPIPAVTAEKQKPVERLVERILAAKAQDPSADVSSLEQEIDKLVYALYGLTAEEIELVEGAQPAKKQTIIAEHALPKGKRVTLGGVKYAIQLVQALLTESADGLTWPRLVDAFTLATQPSLMAQEAASADAAKILAWSKQWNEILPPGALITAIEQLGADNLAVTKSGNTWHISLKTARPKTSAEDVNYDAWLALRTLGPAPEIQLAAPVFAAPNFAVWTQTIEALAA